MVEKKSRSACDGRLLEAKNNSQQAPHSAFAFELQPSRAADQRRRRDLNAEARIQAAIVEWIRIAAPSVLVFAVPNGGLRSKAEAARLKWTGVVPSVPDLAVVATGGRVFFLEVRTEAGRLSPDQHAVHDRLVALGTSAAIVRSIDEARFAGAAWGLETREAPR